MIRQVLNTLNESVTYAFPTEWVKSALLLALMSTCAVIVLFVYLNRNTKKLYFSFLYEQPVAAGDNDDLAGTCKRVLG